MGNGGRQAGTLQGQTWFAELIPGLEQIATAELRRLGAVRLRPAADGVRFEADQILRVAAARTVAALYLSLTFAVPRPKALLGDAAQRRLVGGVKLVAGEHGGGTELSGGTFDGLRLAAAGADSPVMTRLGQELARAADLGYDPGEGELLLRLRPDPLDDGWEALVRITPRPATARAWRVCNRAGGLNAAVAAAMNELTGMHRSDRYLNMMCGSGTLLVERALAAPAQSLVGVDIDPAAITCARRNLEAAGVLPRAQLLVADVADLGPESTADSGPFDVITVDAPWGDAVGGHAQNRSLYPLLFQQAAKLAAPHARLALLTHEVRLVRSLVPTLQGWQLRQELQVAHGGHNPLLLTFSRR